MAAMITTFIGRVQAIMLRTTRERYTALSLLAGMLGAALVQPAGAEDKPPPGPGVAAWVEKRVGEWEIKKEERRFDQIGWTKDIRAAERLAKEHGRPVFLFTPDGRMGVGRC